jgi:hypothetical protein
MAVPWYAPPATLACLLQANEAHLFVLDHRRLRFSQVVGTLDLRLCHSPFRNHPRSQLPPVTRSERSGYTLGYERFLRLDL